MRTRGSGRAGSGSTSRAATPVTPKVQVVRWLARRDYSRAELAQRLRRRGVEDVDIERALDELTAAGYLSDARYAQAVVAQRKGRLGKRAIVQVLKERGIAASDAEPALLQLADSDELEEARVLWQRRFGVPPADDRDKARQVRFLQSRGYSISVALRVLRNAGVTDIDDASA